MRIIDTFLFSEPYEVEVLLIKLNLEYNYIDKFILIENSFSFQGDFKGLHAERILETDNRFKAFRDKILVFSNNFKSNNLNKSKIEDNLAFKVEFWQRDFAYEYIINNYNSNDYVIISDVDEAIDFTSPRRRNEIFDRIKKNPERIIHLSVRRYWYDINNKYGILYGIPLVPIKCLYGDIKSISSIRKSYIGNCKEKWKNIIGFEYSHCFTLKEIERKYSTFSHTGVTISEIKQALRCNHRVMSAKRNTALELNDKYFFEKVRLNRKNSPKYVLENIEMLKTNVVDINYRANRRIDYPELFTWQRILKKKAKSVFRYLIR